MTMELDRPDLDTLTAVIAHSQIVVAASGAHLPVGFDEVDIAVLDWIIAETRYSCYLPM